MRQNRRLFSAYFVLALPLSAGLIALAGCGEAKLPLYPVTGTVLVDGKPAAGARVIFCPIETSSTELQKERPLGTTGPDGKFQLTTFLKDDGVPAGEFKVLVQWLGGPPTPEQQRDGYGGGGSDRLRGKYMKLDSTPLTATITEDTTELPPFELTSQ
jgi:hypothetical protein